MKKNQRKKVYDKYQGHCAYCGCKLELKDMQVDHIIPKSKGGSDDMENLNPSCWACNYYKSDQTIEWFRRQLPLLLPRLRRSFIYRLALKYGLVEEKKKEVVFHFEKEVQE